MIYRGRLIFPVLADIYRLDIAGTDAMTNPADARDEGLDPEYREPIIMPSVDRKGTFGRQEMPVITLPGQMEPDSFNRQQMEARGDIKAAIWGVTFHMADLEQAGLVDQTTGVVLLSQTDRLGAIRQPDGPLIQEFPNPPGLYCVEAKPIGIAFSGRRNLLLVTFQSRNQ